MAEPRQYLSEWALVNGRCSEPRNTFAIALPVDSRTLMTVDAAGTLRPIDAVLGTRIVGPDAAWNEECTEVLATWIEVDSLAGKSTLALARSDASLQRWQVQRLPLPSELGPQTSVTNLHVYPLDAGWQLFTVSRSLRQASVTRGPGGELAVEGMTELVPEEAQRVSYDPASHYVAWTDTRFRKVEQWGRIPGVRLLWIDTDPEWNNNEVFVARLEAGYLGIPVRLTDGLHDWSSVSAASCGSSVVVAWAGLTDFSDRARTNGVWQIGIGRIEPRR